MMRSLFASISLLAFLLVPAAASAYGVTPPSIMLDSTDTEQELTVMIIRDPQDEAVDMTFSIAVDADHADSVTTPTQVTLGAEERTVDIPLTIAADAVTTDSASLTLSIIPATDESSLESDETSEEVVTSSQNTVVGYDILISASGADLADNVDDANEEAVSAIATSAAQGDVSPTILPRIGDVPLIAWIAIIAGLGVIVVIAYVYYTDLSQKKVRKTTTKPTSASRNSSSDSETDNTPE